MQTTWTRVLGTPNCVDDQLLRIHRRRELQSHFRDVARNGRICDNEIMEGTECAPSGFRSPRELRLHGPGLLDGVIAEMAQLCLGPRMLTTPGYFDAPNSTLAQAEEAMLLRQCRTVYLKDGMDVLDLGCGWGALTFYIAEFYPKSKIWSVTDSWTQQSYLEKTRRERGLTNVTIVHQDIASWKNSKKFDRIFTIGLADRANSLDALLHLIANWMKVDGVLLLQTQIWRYGIRDRAFGLSPSEPEIFFSPEELVAHQCDVVLRHRTWIDGRHGAQTCELVLARTDANYEKIQSILNAISDGSAAANAFLPNMRRAFIRSAECLGFREGNEYFIGQYVFEKR